MSLPGFSQEELIRLESEFVGRFGASPTLVAFAPGRVNLMGDHTDYNEGPVLPAAIELGTLLLASPTRAESRLVSMHAGEAVPFAVGTVRPGELDGWARYPAGVAWALREHGALPELDVLVTTRLPVGSSLSSSASLCVAFARLWDIAAGLNLEVSRLALAAQSAEHVFVGVGCGLMDQLASLLGKAGHVMLIDMRSLEHRYVPWPSELALVVCDTGRTRELVHSQYSQRVAECSAACQALGVASLRDVELEMVNRADFSTTFVRDRARHVVTEIARCHALAASLESGDFARIRPLMAESHASLRNNYQVSCVELDEMVSAATESPGCLGSRMTGAGFGGACVSIIERKLADDFVKNTSETYGDRVHTGDPRFIVCEPSDGAWAGPWRAHQF